MNKRLDVIIYIDILYQIRAPIIEQSTALWKGFQVWFSEIIVYKTSNEHALAKAVSGERNHPVC
jgi:hypothetical protein